MKTNIYFLPYLANFFLEWEKFQKNIVEKIKALFFVQLLFFEKPAVYEIKWKNFVHRGGGGGYRWLYGSCALRAGFQKLQVHILR
jgi:hypothetical protein